MPCSGVFFRGKGFPEAGFQKVLRTPFGEYDTLGVCPRKRGMDMASSVEFWQSLALRMSPKIPSPEI